MRILIVDDDQDTALTCAMLLEANGYQAESCLHGDEVMHRIEQARPDVLMLDLAMPKMTGFDVAEEFRACPDLRPQCVIAVTGYGDLATRDKAAAAGFDHFLLKPVDWPSLKAILDECGPS